MPCLRSCSAALDAVAAVRNRWSLCAVLRNYPTSAGHRRAIDGGNGRLGRQGGRTDLEAARRFHPAPVPPLYGYNPRRHTGICAC